MPADHRPTASTITDLALDALYAERDQLAATVQRARAFATEMRGYCSPHGVAALYADRLEAALDGPTPAAEERPRCPHCRMPHALDDHMRAVCRSIRTRLGIPDAPPAEEQQDVCQVVDVDGGPVRVHGARELTDKDRAMLAEVVAAAKRRYAAELQPEPTEVGRRIAESAGLRDALRSTAVLLASTADRIATGLPVDEATLRHAARAARDVADH